MYLELKGGHDIIINHRLTSSKTYTFEKKVVILSTCHKVLVTIYNPYEIFDNVLLLNNTPLILLLVLLIMVFWHQLPCIMYFQELIHLLRLPKHPYSWNAKSKHFVLKLMLEWLTLHLKWWMKIVSKYFIITMKILPCVKA